MFGKRALGQSRGHASVESSLHGLATTLAIFAALLCSGPIFEYTYDPAFEYMANAYGDEALAQLGAFGFGALSCAAVFFLSRVVFVLAVTLIVSRLAMMAI